MIDAFKVDWNSIKQLSLDTRWYWLFGFHFKKKGWGGYKLFIVSRILSELVPAHAIQQQQTSGIGSRQIFSTWNSGSEQHFALGFQVPIEQYICTWILWVDKYFLPGIQAQHNILGLDSRYRKINLHMNFMGWQIFSARNSGSEQHFALGF